MASETAAWPVYVKSLKDNSVLFTDSAVPPNYVITWYELGIDPKVDDAPVDTFVGIYGQGPFDDRGREALERYTGREIIVSPDVYLTQDTNGRPSGSHVTYVPYNDLEYAVGGLESMRDVARVLFQEAGIENPQNR